MRRNFLGSDLSIRAVFSLKDSAKSASEILFAIYADSLILFQWVTW